LSRYPDEPLAVAQHERGLFVPQAYRTNVQTLIGIDKNFITMGRQTADKEHVFSSLPARIVSS
jgi:hypothetical protein